MGPSQPKFRLFQLFIYLLYVSFIRLVLSENHQYIQTTTESGEVLYLEDNRRPALYTQNFGDCLGNSLINVTRFDAAYYKDNMTVVFHLQGNTNIANDSIMMYIGVFAYGESRFDLTFNPCNAQIYSLCPMNRSVLIEADGIIPVDQSDVSGIPPLALSIPDFEGQAILRIFSNSTENEIGCYSAIITNGASFSQPRTVGTLLGIFTAIAFVSSFATAVYGNDVPNKRTHYAHSLSVLVVFAVFHHVYFTGALSMNWPSVLTAWCSNFAWSAGMIYSQPMQNSINQFIGSNKGNTTAVGAAGLGLSSNGLGGGYQISQIYRRSVNSLYHPPRDNFDFSRSRHLETAIAKRTLANASEGFSWYGKPVPKGVPIPGNYSGFAGTLSMENIPASNAFMTGFLWFLALLAMMTALVGAFKGILELASIKGLIRSEKLSHFKAHWVAYTAQVVLRSMLIGFFMMIFLALFQFTYGGGPGAIAIAAVVFVTFFCGSFGVAGYALFHRLRFSRYELKSDRLHFEKLCAKSPSLGFGLESRRSEKSEPAPSLGSIPWLSFRFIDEAPERITVHQDEDYVQRFGWLTARFRRTRWWAFSLWLIYDFVRACFFGGAAGHPLRQVFGLLIVEFLALMTIVALRPFEGVRLNALMVYLLGFSKVATVALSAAFDTRFNLTRIATTAIGIVIIVIQGILVFVLLVAIVGGAISSYISVTRDQERFKPHSWEKHRQRYFNHLQKAATDLPQPSPTPVEEIEVPCFNVKSVRREAKIEDEGEGAPFFVSNHRSIVRPLRGSTTARASQGNDTHSLTGASPSNLPFGAQGNRASWSTVGFQNPKNQSSGDARQHVDGTL